ncbi:uncharacterized protein LOC119603629 [Lucilia sericata]|uniref:uncharacterized protein LOC119603629 n=1 Tax=Lucilia sericata TaxID=13632 RepID=UPI0018A83838|nr:uncharacterized protein LOC119603629 [Lucilia sericata]
MSTSEDFGSASSLIPSEVSRVTMQNTTHWLDQSRATSSTMLIILWKRPAENKYEALKCSILDEFIESEEKRLRQLLENVSVGDKKQSTLLREMRTLASAKVSEELLMTLWIQRLPSTTKAILSVSNDTIDKLCLIADKIHDQNDSAISISAVSADNDERISNLENTIQEIFSKLDALSIGNRRRNRSSSRNLPRNRTRSPSEKTFCCYHHRFGSRATKCRPPCSLKSSENN